MKFPSILTALALAALSAAQSLPIETESDRKPKVQTGGNVLIRGGRVVTVTKGTLAKADILVRNGKIVQIGQNLAAPAGFAVIDAAGKVVTPGIVDGHIHRGILTTNEGSDSITAEVRIRDGLNPEAKSVWQALAGGETAGLALHGSANSVGGESVVVKLKYRRPVDEMPVKDAPRMIKFALGENVTRSGSATSTRFPKTRMGVQALYRRAFTQAREYNKAWDDFRAGRTKTQPRMDVRLQTLGDILRKKVWVQCHSYRADEMLMMVRLSQEFGFKIGAMQHGLESYKIAPELAKAGVGVSIFVDNWSFKIEGYDGIPYNAAICHAAGVNVSINTDGVSGMPSIAIDGAKPMRWGGVSETDAMRMLTINPAKQLGIDHRTGSLEVGKDADIVIWNGHPFSVYSRCEMTMIEGEVYFQKRDAFGLDAASTFKSVLDVNKKTAPLKLPNQAPAYLIRGASIHRVSVAPLQRGDVLVQGGKIAAVGQKLTNLPRGTVIVNGAGLHVFPGFIDAGTSMGLQEISGIGQMVDTTELGGNQPDLIAATAMQPQSEHFPVARAGGVLTTLVRPSGGTVSGQASLIHTFGWTTEQMATGDRMLVVNLGGGGGGFGGQHAHDEDDDCCGEDQSANFNLLGEYLGGANDEEARGAQDQEGGQGPAASGSADETERAFIAALDYRKARQANSSLPLNLSHEAMLPYLDGKRTMLLRVGNVASIRRALTLIEKYKLKAVLSGAAESWKIAKEIADKKVPVIISPAGRSTLSANAPTSDWDPYETPFALPALLKRAGVKFCFHTENNSASYLLPVRVGQSCGYGLSRTDALRSITLSAAEILGVGSSLGSIDKGKIANLVITDGDPFELTTNYVGVFVNGVPRPLDSRFTRLRDQWSARLTGR